MGKHAKKKTRRDVAEIARANLEQIIGEKLTGEPLDTPPDPEPDTRNQAAVALSKLGASKGGKARAAKLSAKKRAEIAKKAAKVRWSNNKSLNIYKRRGISPTQKGVMKNEKSLRSRGKNRSEESPLRRDHVKTVRPALSTRAPGDY